MKHIKLHAVHRPSAGDYLCWVEEQEGLRFEWEASNGLYVISNSNPFFRVNDGRPTLWVRGTTSTRDHEVLHIPAEHFPAVCEAIREFNAAHGEQKPAESSGVIVVE